MTKFSQRQLISVLISAFLWTALLLSFIFVPLKAAVQETVYREIKIQLAPMAESELPDVPEPEAEPVVPDVQEPLREEIVEAPPMVEETVVVETAEPAPAAAAPVVTEPAPAPAKAEPAPAAPAPKVSEPAPVTKQADPAPAAKTPTPAPELAKQTLVKSVDQLMAEQNASRGTKKTAADVDWDALFGDSSSATSSVSTGQKTFAAQTGPAISGSAASSASDTGTQAAVSSGKATESSASEATANALNSIGTASAVRGSAENAAGTAVGGIAGGTGVSGGSSSDDTAAIDWGSAPGRKLVRPSTTEIQFTAEQKALITTSVRNIRISFTVAADGTVQRNSISIDKKASLPAAISQEIERQISEWFFETGIADGQAVFVYSIIKE